MRKWIFSKKYLPLSGEEVGNKAFNLFQAVECANVPSFITLHSAAMLNVLKLEENGEIERALRSLWTNKLSILEHLESIRQLIVSLKIPHEFMENVRDELKNNGIHPPYSVRSSSVYEDMNENSAPGVFESYLDVSETELENAIKKCWASNFSERSMLYFGNYFQKMDDIKMGVIIQNMQHGTYAGILFTINPVTLCEEYVVEMVSDYSDSLTDGESIGTRLLLDPDTRQIKNSQNADENMVAALADLATDLKGKFSHHVDVEWSYRDGNVYLIQVRPVSTLYKGDDVKEECIIRSISNIEDIQCDSTGIGRKFTRWKGKKQHFFRSCDHCGVKHLEWYFVKNYDENHRADIERLLDTFSGEFVTLAVNETLADVVKRKEEVCSFIKEYSNINKNSIISFRDVPYNELSVISNYVDGKGVYIEVIDGILKGLKTGELRGTTYEFDFAGNIIAKQEYREKQKYVIEFPSGETFLVPNDMILLERYEKLFAQIAKWTIQLYEENQHGAVEWWICKEDAYAADISISHDNIAIFDSKEVHYISNGVIEGYAYVIDDEMVEALKDIAFGLGISVDRIDANVFEHKALKQIRSELVELKKKGHVVLVIDRPHLGIAPLLDHVSGIVFREASMLCHLSVMLREKRIPAIVVGDRIQDITVGKHVEYMTK